MLLFYVFTSICIIFLQNHTTRAATPNLCDPRGTVQCENYETCCLLSNGQYGCCPFTAANCCLSTNFCCPAGFRCGNSSCLRMNL